MNLNNVKKWPVDNNVPEQHYVIDELGRRSLWCRLYKKHWYTYYSERGCYENVEKYGSEDEACRAFSECIRYMMEGQYSIKIHSLN